MRGFTLVEVLLALAVAALGFALGAAGIPAALRYASEADGLSAASAVALRYVSLLDGLPPDADDEALRDRFRLAFPDAPGGPDRLPRLSELSPGLLYSEPDGTSGVFEDPFTGFRVRIAFAASVAGPPSRCYVVWVRTPRGDWLPFPFLRCGR